MKNLLHKEEYKSPGTYTLDVCPGQSIFTGSEIKTVIIDPYGSENDSDNWN